MNLNEKIEQVDLKARQLALKLEHLQEKNAKLTGENQNLQYKLENAIHMIADLEEKLEVTEKNLLKKQSDDPKQVKELRKKIDHSLKDLDSCIDWLENN